jgi:ABC-type dipeptide/oligopeptide/nickel transport system permease component
VYVLCGAVPKEVSSVSSISAAGDTGLITLGMSVNEDLLIDDIFAIQGSGTCVKVAFQKQDLSSRGPFQRMTYFQAI